MMDLDGLTPPGWKHSVEKMKKHGDISNPFALAWYLTKHGAKPHREDADADALFDAAICAALAHIQAYGMSELCAMAAHGDLAACIRLLDGSTTWVQERGW